jgi:hypothetical protein
MIDFTVIEILRPHFSAISIVSPTLTAPSSTSHRIKKSPLSPRVGVSARIRRRVGVFTSFTAVFDEAVGDGASGGVEFPQLENSSRMKKRKKIRIIIKN